MMSSEFFERIETATNYTFTQKQLDRLKSEFQNISNSSATKIISAIETCATVPRNVYGYTMGFIRDFANSEMKESLSRESWKVKSGDCATAEEFKLTMKCIGMLSKFENSNELLVKFGEYLNKAIDGNFLLQALKKAEVVYQGKIDCENRKETITLF
jgi:hypothetical protein